MELIIIINNWFLCAKVAELNKRIRVGAVSYLNILPLIFGIKKSELMDRIELIEDYPAIIANKLLRNEIDIGLVPVAVIPQLQTHQIITDYCIGAEGEVASVALFSQVPIAEVRKVILDYQSMTSVRLAQILLKEYWQLDVEIEHASPNYLNQIKGTTAGVVIGDRALKQRIIFPYIYDLASAWKKHTNLPFVFAAWVANKPIDTDFLLAFNQANGFGLQHLDEVVATTNFDGYDLMHYYTHNISYQLTAEKLKGLDRFLKYIKGIS